MKVSRLLFPVFIVSLLLFGCASTGGSKAAKPAPDFKVALSGGGEASLAQFRGKPLVLNFGASWCPHCQHELPGLNASYNKYKGDVGFLAIFMKSKKEDVDALIEKDSLGFKVALDPDASVAALYGVRGIPVTFFIDEGGNIVDDYFGGISESGMSSKIESLIHEK